MTKEDSKIVDDFCQSKGISPLNTRLFKEEDGSFNLKICSKVSNIMSYIGSHDHKGINITVSSGDFAEIMNAVVYNME